jgi:anaerobic selenocysteine-containing dehydrogenase
MNSSAADLSDAHTDLVADLGVDGEADAPKPGTRTAFRTCPLCEAGCGLEITVVDNAVTRIRGDMADVFSRGYLCPKGSTLKQLHDDPDRLRRPLIKRDGRHVEVSWAEAFDEADRLLNGVINSTGRQTVAVYLGNPTAHSLSASIHGRTLINAIGTKHRFSASTVDQMPKHVAAGYLFGTPVGIPVPDLDRTDYLLMLGADPLESNGSLCTAPDFPGRLQAIRDRGGKVVVVDPRRSSTAKKADEWIGVRPGTDALFLLSLVSVLFEENLARPARPELLDGLDQLQSISSAYSPETVSAHTGVDPGVVRRIAHEITASPTAAVYGRVGISMQRFGTLSNWLVDVVNILTGNLDRPGGAMFPTPACGNPTTHARSSRKGSGFRVGRGSTRVRGLPEVMGEYPVATMAEEIATPGDGKIRALITVAGNPVLSTPDGETLAAAFASLDCMISVDLYLNETTRHAHVILPAPSALQKSHYDVLLSQFNVRNVANYSPAVLPLDEGQPDEWEILCRLAAIAKGLGPNADPHAVAEIGITGMLTAAASSSDPHMGGRDIEELRAQLEGKTGPERALDVMLRTGPFGDRFGARPDGLSLDTLIDHPHGVDLGPLQPRLDQVVRTPSGMIELVPAPIAADLERLDAARSSAPLGDPTELLLVGRRQLRSNNSWMHNINVLMKGKERCTLQMHPTDASRFGIVSGGVVSVESATNRIVAPIEITDDIVPGVVSLPHGWGHDAPGTQMRVAAARPGANSNLLAGTTIDDLDVPSGTSILNGILVRVAPADQPTGEAVSV